MNKINVNLNIDNSFNQLPEALKQNKANDFASYLSGVCFGICLSCPQDTSIIIKTNALFVFNMYNHNQVIQNLIKQKNLSLSIIDNVKGDGLFFNKDSKIK